VRKAEELAAGDAIAFQGPGPAPLPRGHVMPAQRVEASRQAAAIIADAQRRAAQLLAESEGELERVRERVEREARAQAASSFAERLIALQAHEATGDERALDRVVGLARLLAERLLGEALALDPSRITALARTALGEARGARSIRIVAHPEDCRLLEGLLAAAAFSHVTQLVVDSSRARGSLRLETELGVLDADLAPQLDRLAARLRESLAHGR
jgi:flagellar biosynthesis/type III secretory pathway protein FliH